MEELMNDRLKYLPASANETVPPILAELPPVIRARCVCGHVQVWDLAHVTQEYRWMYLRQLHHNNCHPCIEKNISKKLEEGK